MKLKNATEKIKEFHKTSGNRDCRICKRYANNVCTDFNIFVCPVCSGVLREFNFKIKGISMTAWTNDDASKICSSGGNAADLASNGKESIHREATDVEVRSWIKATYVDKIKPSGYRQPGASTNIEEESKQLANMFPADISQERAKQLVQKYGSLEQAIDEYLTEKEKAMVNDKNKKDKDNKKNNKKKHEKKKKDKGMDRDHETISKTFTSFGGTEYYNANSSKGTPNFGVTAPESSPYMSQTLESYDHHPTPQSSTNLNWAQRIAEQNQLAEQQQQLMIQQQQHQQQ